MFSQSSGLFAMFMEHPAHPGNPLPGPDRLPPHLELAPAPGPAAAARNPILPAALLAGTWLLVTLIHLLGSPGLRPRNWLASLLLLQLLAAASLAWRAWRSPAGLRRAWWLLTIAALLDTVNIIESLLQALGHVSLRLPGPSNLLNLLLGGFLLAGIMDFPKHPDRRGLGRRGALDALLFAASLLFLLWALGVQSSLRLASQGVGLRVFVAYLNVALLGGALMFMTGNRPDLARGPLGWLSASILSWLAALAMWTLAGLPPIVEDRLWIVLAGGIPVFQGLAAWSGAGVGAVLPARDLGRDPSRRLPLILVATGIAVLAVLLAVAPGNVTRGTYAIFLVMVVLLLLRMLQGIRELRAARNSLEARVLQRTQALVQAQDTLLRAERMNAVATLGAGLAHDLNNFLAVIHNSAELAQAGMAQGRPASERDLARILEASEQAGRLTRRLMSYGRRDSGPEQGLNDVARTVEAMRELLRMLLPRDISLGFDLAAGAGPVQVDSAVLEQVLVNLVSNAKDAMPGGGAVAIRLRPGAMPSGEPAALLEVSDTGPGIPADLHEVIFDAFFTTKAVGLGTGLGLASVRTLMAAQGGSVSVTSAPGQGTTFQLAFPVAVNR
jgi:signal transduction histidine kinase